MTYKHYHVVVQSYSSSQISWAIALAFISACGGMHMFQTEGPGIKTPIVYGRDESRFQKTPGIQHQGIERCLWAYPG